MKNIFISYSNKDKEFYKETRERLLKAGFKPWMDPNPTPGMDWRYEIDDAIRASDGLVVVITPNAMKSIYVTYEWSFALGVGVKVIPVIFKEAELHPRLMGLEKFDYYGWKDAAHFWDYFLRELHTLVNIPLPQKASPAPDQPAAAPAQPAAQPVSAKPAYNRTVMPTSPGHWLVIRRGPNLNAMYQVDTSPEQTIGRDANSNEIAINDPEISRQHVRILFNGQNVLVEDLGSTNGTFVNSVRLQSGFGGPHLLHNHDVIGLGDAIMLSYEIVG